MAAISCSETLGSSLLPGLLQSGFALFFFYCTHKSASFDNKAWLLCCGEKGGVEPSHTDSSASLLFSYFCEISLKVRQQLTAHGGEKKGRWLNRGSGLPAYLPAVLSDWDWLDYVIPSNLFFTSSEYRNSSSACLMETAAAPNTLRDV